MEFSPDVLDEALNTYALSAPRRIESGELTRLRLDEATVAFEGISVADDGAVSFERRGWFEVLLTVAWDPDVPGGHRFAHTAIPDSHPLHSEAIEADVLRALSQGRQLLRGTTVMDPSSPVASVALEVWQDSRQPVMVREASLAIRLLARSL